MWNPRRYWTTVWRSVPGSTRLRCGNMRGRFAADIATPVSWRTENAVEPAKPLDQIPSQLRSYSDQRQYVRRDERPVPVRLRPPAPISLTSLHKCKPEE